MHWKEPSKKGRNKEKIGQQFSIVGKKMLDIEKFNPSNLDGQSNGWSGWDYVSKIDISYTASAIERSRYEQ